MKLLDNLDGKTFDTPPVWMMRQAGRYLSEYRDLRKQAGSFLNLCYTPEHAIEVTMQPIRRFGFDAAILFSDILVIPDALGQDVRFEEGRGPVLEPISKEEIDQLSVERVVEHLQPVFQTVSGLRSELPTETALIGFCGAPWTVATYMIAGHGTPDQAPARIFAMKEPEAFQKLIDILIEASSRYLIEQVKAGANCLQVFDTWAGVLGEKDFEQFSIRPLQKIIEKVRAEKPGTRFIGFPKGAGVKLPKFIDETDINGVGVDWTVPLSYVRNEIQPKTCVQGNLDPLLLIGGGSKLKDQTQRICEELKSGPHIFNLGHGITPPTPIENVELMIETVRSFKG